MENLIKYKILKIKNQIYKLNIKYIFFFICLFAILYLIFNISLVKLNKNKASIVNPSITTVKVAMGYIPDVQFTPFYMAIDKGYFKQEGLDIDFNYGFETDIINLLAKNDLQFGIGSGEQVILAREQGLPVINFFNWYQRFPVSITSLKKTNINKPTDLIGKKVGIPAVYGASYIGWQAFIRQNQLPEKQIKLDVVGYTQVASLIEGKDQAVVTYAMNEPIQLKAMGYEINNFEVADQANFVSNGLLTNEQTMKEKPQLIQGFANAFAKGLQDTINNPDEAFGVAKKFIPEIKDENTAKMVLKETILFWRANRLGLNDPNQWQQSVDLLKELNLIKEKPAIDSLYTNQFIL